MPRATALPIGGLAVCYHIVRWYDSVRVAPAIRRCYRSMSADQTARRRGIKGDRPQEYLVARSRDLGIAA